MLHDYSNVQEFYDDNSMSDLSLFKKVDRSINVTPREKSMHEISIQHEPNIFEKN